MKSDVVHLIVVRWAFLLQSLGVEQIVHTRWPTEIFAHACIDVNPYQLHALADGAWFEGATKVILNGLVVPAMGGVIPECILGCHP